MATSADIAYARIRDGVLDGRYPPGSALREEQLAADLGVSRTPVREALRRLNAEALVEFVANHGARVARWSPADIRETFDLRAMLEGHACSLAAHRRSDAQLAELQRLADAMSAAHAGATGIERIAERNRRFHDVILEASGTRQLPRIVGRIVDVPLVLRTFNRYSAAALARSLAHHHEITAALRAQDGDWARAVMEAHIRAARAALLGNDAPD